MARLRRHAEGHPVKFRKPGGGQQAAGQILDEVWAREPEEFAERAPANDGWREAAFVAQLIDWGGGYRSVRVTYYLRPEGGGPDGWYFGGQYAASMSMEEYRSLLNRLNAKAW